MKERLYKVQLTPTQICELLEWHESHVEKYRRMGIKEDYLKIHQESPLAIFLSETSELVEGAEKIIEGVQPHISQ